MYVKAPRKQHCVCTDISNWHGLFMCLTHRKSGSSCNLTRNQTLSDWAVWICAINCCDYFTPRTHTCTPAVHPSAKHTYTHAHVPAEAGITGPTNGMSWENPHFFTHIWHDDNERWKCCWKYSSQSWDGVYRVWYELLCFVVWQRLINCTLSDATSHFLSVINHWLKSASLKDGKGLMSLSDIFLLLIYCSEDVLWENSIHIYLFKQISEVLLYFCLQEGAKVTKHVSDLFLCP